MPPIEHIGQAVAELRRARTPPLDEWQPRQSLDIGLRIAADGQWYYRGSVIRRRRLVALFGSVLRLEPDGGHYLITPRLKYPVSVDDAPFQAVEVQRQGAGRAQNLVFRTNIDDWVLADRDHPVRVQTDPKSGRVSPRIEVRDGLQARICRSVYYELAQMLEPDNRADDGGGEILGLYSAGEFFPFGRLTDESG